MTLQAKNTFSNGECISGGTSCSLRGESSASESCSGESSVFHNMSNTY